MIDTNYDEFFSEENDFCDQIKDQIIDSETDDEIYNIICNLDTKVDAFIIDNSGNVIIKGDNRYEKNFDMNVLINKDKYILHSKYNIEYTNLIKISENRYILFKESLSEGDNLLPIIPLSFAIFIVSFFMCTSKEINYIKILNDGIRKIAEGDLNSKVQVRGNDEISNIAQNINYMSQKLYEAEKYRKISEEKKDTFIMNISHDIRTPLTSVIGYIELVKEKYTGDDEIKDYINIASDKSERLRRLINDFFEYNKLTIGKTKLNKVNISLNEFLRQTVEEIMPELKNKNLDFSLNFPNYEIQKEIDPELMYRVIENLLSNAVKYCDENSKIIVNLYKKENRVIISIENQCSEFNKDNIKFIFDRFYRGDKSRNSRKAGAGLGLAIVKDIIEKHNGTVSCEYDNKIVKMVIQL